MNKKTQYMIISLILTFTIMFLYISSSISYKGKNLYLIKNSSNYNNIFTFSNIKNTINDKKLERNQLDLMGLLPLKSMMAEKSDEIQIYAGGNPVGVKIATEGVLVVGYSNISTKSSEIESPAKLAGVELGDTLLKINNMKIEDAKDLAKKLKQLKKNEVTLSINRNGQIIEKIVKCIKVEEENSVKIGLWVRDSTAGVGTMTFYDINNKKYGALGHPITDNDTNVLLNIKEGKLIQSSIISVRKGQKGSPGELKGIFTDEQSPLGNVKKNTQCGIFGDIGTSSLNNRFNGPYKVAYKDEIKEGKAKIITTVDDQGPKMYDIEIVKLLPQDKAGPKSMIIKVTDQELLNKTGGIVQGMSGSPIIQNDKIIGAVTHVLINKPDVGYGIYIEWMLKDAGIIN